MVSKLFMSKKRVSSFLFLILVISLISFISAQELKFTGQQNTELNIFNECEDNGFPCDSNYKCNITIITPSQTILVLNDLMTRNQTIYNYTLNTDQTSILGLYEDSMCCTNNSHSGCELFLHEITPSGSTGLNEGQGSSLIGILIILLVTTIFFLILGILTKSVPFKMFFVSLSILLMIGTIGFGVTIMQNFFGTFSSLVSGFGTFYTILIILLSGGAVGLLIYLIMVAFRVYKIKRGILSE